MRFPTTCRIRAFPFVVWMRAVVGTARERKEIDMPQYLVAVYDQPDTRSRPAEEMADVIAAVGAVNQKAMDAGIFVFGGGLHDQSATTTVDRRSGKAEFTDGPYLETKEYLGGFWVIDVPDLDAALSWASEAAAACQQPLEVRPFMEEPPQGS
jgi:hypothetical protein